MTALNALGVMMTGIFGGLLLLFLGCMVADLDSEVRPYFFITVLLVLLGIALMFV